jgi:hypothetical protein
MKLKLQCGGFVLGELWRSCHCNRRNNVVSVLGRDLGSKCVGDNGQDFRGTEIVNIYVRSVLYWKIRYNTQNY